jgi:hypothetical protein
MISSAQELFFIRVHIPMGMPLRFLVQPMQRILSYSGSSVQMGIIDKNELYLKSNKGNNLC